MTSYFNVTFVNVEGVAVNSFKAKTFEEAVEIAKAGMCEWYIEITEINPLWVGESNIEG